MQWVAVSSTLAEIIDLPQKWGFSIKFFWKLLGRVAPTVATWPLPSSSATKQLPKSYTHGYTYVYKRIRKTVEQRAFSNGVVYLIDHIDDRET